MLLDSPQHVLIGTRSACWRNDRKRLVGNLKEDMGGFPGRVTSDLEFGACKMVTGGNSWEYKGVKVDNSPLKRLVDLTFLLDYWQG